MIECQERGGSISFGPIASVSDPGVPAVSVVSPTQGHCFAIWVILPLVSEQCLELMVEDVVGIWTEGKYNRGWLGKEADELNGLLYVLEVPTFYGTVLGPSFDFFMI